LGPGGIGEGGDGGGGRRMEGGGWREGMRLGSYSFGGPFVEV